MEQSRRFISYQLSWDDMPLDISYLFEKEKPAGRHGFLVVDNDRMVFEDGSIAKFWE